MIQNIVLWRLWNEMYISYEQKLQSVAGERKSYQCWQYTGQVEISPPGSVSPQEVSGVITYCFRHLQKRKWWEDLNNFCMGFWKSHIKLQTCHILFHTEKYPYQCCECMYALDMLQSGQFLTRWPVCLLRACNIYNWVYA